MEALQLASGLLLATGAALQLQLQLRQRQQSGAESRLQCACAASASGRRQRQAEMRLRCRAVSAEMEEVAVVVPSSPKRRRGRKKAEDLAVVQQVAQEEQEKEKGDVKPRRRRARKVVEEEAVESVNAGLDSPRDSVEEREREEEEKRRVEMEASDFATRLGGLRLRSEYRAGAERESLEGAGLGRGSINLTKTSSSSWVFQALGRLHGAGSGGSEPEEAVGDGKGGGGGEGREGEFVGMTVQGLESESGVPARKKRAGRRSKASEAVVEVAEVREDVVLSVGGAADEDEDGKGGAGKKARRRSRGRSKVSGGLEGEEKAGGEEEEKAGVSEVEDAGVGEVGNEVSESEVAGGGEGEGGVEQEKKRRRRRGRRKAAAASEVQDVSPAVSDVRVEESSEVEEVEGDSAEAAGSCAVMDEKAAEQGVRQEGSSSRKRERRKKKGQGNVVIAAKARCGVEWSVQAQLKVGQRLFLCGSVPELGAWDPSLAVQMVRVKGEGVWEAKRRIECGADVEYNYFVGSGDGTADIVWRPGGRFEFQVPDDEKSGEQVVTLQDVWALNTPENVSSLLWGKWWDEVGTSGSLKASPVKDPVNGRSVLNEEVAKKTAVEKEGLVVELPDSAGKELESSSASKGPDLPALVTRQIETNVLIIDDWLKKKIRRKVLPREEPWLLESELLAERQVFLRTLDEKKQAAKAAASDLEESQEQRTEKEQETMVEILINAPESTMQRMAILEDSKLAELLLEPVNSKVQVGNIYLGCVKQLLPGMVGVFVDIGSPRMALLDITRNVQPYTFPALNSHKNEDHGADQDLEPTGDEEDIASVMDQAGGDHDVVDVESEHTFGDDEGEEDVDVTPGSQNGRPLRDSEGGDVVGEGPHTPTLIVGGARPLTVNFGRKFSRWRNLEEGMKIIVQVKKEAMGKKGPRLTAYPTLAGRFWVVVPNGDCVGISQKISGPERSRLRGVAQNLQTGNFGLTVRTEAMGHTSEELEKDITRLCETWNDVMERAEAAATAAENGVEDAVPVLLHRAMGQTLTVVRDFFNDKVHRMVVDSAQCYQEVTSYLAEVAPHLLNRVELYSGKQPIFDAFNIESQIDKFSSERVQLSNGAYLVVQETEALVSIDVNGGIGMLNVSTSQKDAILEVNLAAARQIATELRLRDVGGIIVVDFIDMEDEKHEALVVEEMKRAIARDRSKVYISDISQFGVMELTRKRVRPSVTLTISDPCSCCRGAGRVEARETTLSKIERAIQRSIAEANPSSQVADLGAQKWPQVTLRVDTTMFDYLRSWKSKRITQLSSALKVWINLKVSMEYTRGQFQVVPVGNKSQRPSVDPSTIAKRIWTSKHRKYLGSRDLGAKKVALASKEEG